MFRADLGLAMIAQNERAHMPASIAQFFHIAQDIVVVDGGSQDDTVLWAQRLGARVISRPFSNDFSAQKNFAIQQLSTSWIYLHDPDERLEPGTVELLPLLTCADGQKMLMEQEIIPFSDTLFDCFGFARKNYIDGVQTSVYPDYQYRLFRKHCFFEGAVHERIAGFENRTEVDYKRTEIAVGSSFSKSSRFNILHYKSRERQEMQDNFYRRLRGETQ